MRKTPKFSEIKKMLFEKEDLRWATPEIVADYRARRLKCGIIIDLCCGIGGQSIFFGKYCKKVIAIDKDEKRIEFAKKNAEVYGIKNVEFMAGDVLDKNIIDKIKKIKPNIIFCDPNRLAEEKERNIRNISPGIDEIQAAYKIKELAFEAPPQLVPEKIDYDCEKEYLSVNRMLNRLTLYFGKLKKADVSAVSLPGGSIIFSSKNKTGLESCESPRKYLYAVDTSVTKANLLAELIDDIDDKNKKVYFFNKSKVTLLTSDSLIKNDFLSGYILIKKMKNNFSDILNILKKNDFGNVILRSNINPEDYWKERRRFESKLDGERTAHLFVINDEVLICEKVV